MTEIQLRRLRLSIWFLLVPLLVYVYGFRRDLLQNELERAAATSVVIGYAVYLALGAIRGFTLIPSTGLVLLGIPLFRPGPLLVLTLAGILVSSTCIYYFAESLKLDRLFEEKHSDRLLKVKRILSQNQLPIIIGWSFFPLAPTDLICYAAGVLRIHFLKFVVGVLIGEGSICALYIFAGNGILHALHLR